MQYPFDLSCEYESLWDTKQILCCFNCTFWTNVVFTFYTKPSSTPAQSNSKSLLIDILLTELRTDISWELTRSQKISWYSSFSTKRNLCAHCLTQWAIIASIICRKPTQRYHYPNMKEHIKVIQQCGEVEDMVNSKKYVQTFSGFSY